MSNPSGRAAGGATTIPIAKGQLMDIDWLNGGAIVVDRKTTAKDVTGTAVTDLLNGEFTLPANVLGTQGMARFTMWGDIELDGGTGFPDFGFKLGATDLFGTTSANAGGFAASTTRGSWRAIVELMNLGATNAQLAHLAVFLYGNNTAAAANVNVVPRGAGPTWGAKWVGHLTGSSNDWGITPAIWEVHTTATVDTTADQVAQFTVDLRNATGDDCQLLAATLEII